MRLVIRVLEPLYVTLFFLELVIKNWDYFGTWLNRWEVVMEAGASGLHYERGRS